MRACLYQGPDSSGPTPTVAALVGAIGDAADRAAAAGAVIVVCPEMSATGYNIGVLVEERAEPSDGPMSKAVAEIAVRAGIAVAYGYPELADGVVHNSVQVIDASGAALANYRKTHLFGDLDRDHFVPGDTLVTQFDLGGVRCGLLVCYDVEFPEAVRAHSDSGTQWLIVPTGLMSPYEHVAEKLVPTRAYESQMFVSYVNRCGTESGIEYCGLSVTVAPDGAELARAGRGSELIAFDVDTEQLAISRSVNTHLDDRRIDLYEERTR